MKINRDENGNIIEVIFAEGEDQNAAWFALQNLESQRQFQESMKRLSQPMMPMMPMMGGMNNAQLKAYPYQNQSEGNSKRFQEQIVKINKEAAEQMAAINRQTAQQIDELTKHAAEYAFDTPQPQNAEKN